MKCCFIQYVLTNHVDISTRYEYDQLKNQFNNVCAHASYFVSKCRLYSGQLRKLCVYIYVCRILSSKEVMH